MTATRPRPPSEKNPIDPPLLIPVSGTTNTEEFDITSYRAIACLGDGGGVRGLISTIAKSVLARSTNRLVVVGDDDFDLDSKKIERIKAIGDLQNSLKQWTTHTVILGNSACIKQLSELQMTSQTMQSYTLVSTEMHQQVDAVIIVDEHNNLALFYRHRQQLVQQNLPAKSTLSQTNEILFDNNVAQLPPISVNILGPISISGTDYPLARHPKLTELVVYLALHNGGATTRNWTTALWPERRVPPQTVANRLSEVRRILGFAVDGRPRLRRNGERHCLVEVTSDWENFQRLSPADATPREWQEALALIRGRPFDELAQGQWVIFEGYTSEIERAISDCGLALGEYALNVDEPDLAGWAVQQALRACPFDERLHRLLMRCADAEGNRAGVEATLRQLALLLEIDGDPLYGVHPKTAELYERLIGRDRHQTSARRTVV